MSSESNINFLIVAVRLQIVFSLEKAFKASTYEKKIVLATFTRCYIYLLSIPLSIALDIIFIYLSQF